MNEKKWIELIFSSIKGIQRAHPVSDLFTTIAGQIVARETKAISIHQWRRAAVAAVLLIALNIYGIRDYVRNSEIEITEAVVETYPAESLFFNYQFYDL